MTKTSTTLREYVYVDFRRLDSYFQQVSSPVTYDKVPTWKMSISIAGPIGEGAATRPARPFTVHEKIVALLEYLSAKDLLMRGPLDDADRWRDARVFCLDSIIAKRALVPARVSVGSDTPSISFWLSSTPLSREQASAERRPLRGHNQHLYLIEDLKCDDHERPYNMSGYSALEMLAQDLDDAQCAQLGLRSGSAGEHTDRHQRFSRDPAGFLVATGARVLPERRISVLYRLRAACNDTNALVRGELAVFGYIIAAWETLSDNSERAPGRGVEKKWWQFWS